MVLAPEHPLAGAADLSLGELADERHILPGQPLIVHDRVDLLYRHQDLAPVNRITCNDIRMIKNLIRQGGGVAILSLLDVQQEVHSGQLCFVPLRSKLARPLTLALCIAPARQLSRAAQMTLQHLTRVIEDMHTRH